MLGPLLDEHRSMLREFPHGLGVAWDERWRGAEQPLVPGQRRRVVVDWDSCVQVDGHAAMLIEPHLARRPSAFSWQAAASEFGFDLLGPLHRRPALAGDLVAHPAFAAGEGSRRRRPDLEAVAVGALTDHCGLPRSCRSDSEGMTRH